MNFTSTVIEYTIFIFTKKISPLGSLKIFTAIATYSKEDFLHHNIFVMPLNCWTRRLELLISDNFLQFSHPLISLIVILQTHFIFYGVYTVFFSVSHISLTTFFCFSGLPLWWLCHNLLLLLVIKLRESLLLHSLNMDMWNECS